VRSTAVAYLLWLFFGVLGVHRFYCGRIGTGILWFFTGGLLLVGWIIDVFLIPDMVRTANAPYFYDWGGYGPPSRPPIAPPMAAPMPGSEPVHGVVPGYRVVFCTRCGNPMQVPQRAVGSAYACPHCRTVLEVPALA